MSTKENPVCGVCKAPCKMAGEKKGMTIKMVRDIFLAPMTPENTPLYDHSDQDQMREFIHRNLAAMAVWGNMGLLPLLVDRCAQHAFGLKRYRRRVLSKDQISENLKKYLHD